MKHLFSALFLFVCLIAPAQAQTGYQVSLLNTATGEPQANKTVNVNIAITNAENEVVHTEIQTATTNDFGILSLSVGNEDTFKNADWNKLPFYISVSADGTLIGKSQILTVPVAEYAKTAGPVLTKEMVVGTWSYKYSVSLTASTPSTVTTYHSITFNADGTGYSEHTSNGIDIDHFTWEIIGLRIYTYTTAEESMWGIDLTYTSENLAPLWEFTYLPTKNKLSGGAGRLLFSKE